MTRQRSSVPQPRCHRPDHDAILSAEFRLPLVESFWLAKYTTIGSFCQRRHAVDDDALAGNADEPANLLPRDARSIQTPLSSTVVVATRRPTVPKRRWSPAVLGFELANERHVIVLRMQPRMRMRQQTEVS